MATLIEKSGIGVKTVLAILLPLAVLTGCKEKTEPEERAASPSVEAETTIAAPSAAPATEPDRLRILYVGMPGSGREEDFVRFLGEHFATVETADLKTFEQSQCDGYDVTILDYDGDLFKAPRPQFSLQFSRPVLTVGVPGAFICSQNRLKTGYL